MRVLVVMVVARALVVVCTSTQGENRETDA